MHPMLRAILVGAALMMAAAGSARAQGYGGTTVSSGPGAMNGLSAPVVGGPAFASAYGPTQGYGYAPSIAWPRAPLNYHYYYEITLSSPYRPGSTNFLPPLGYFVMGNGPYIFP